MTHTASLFRRNARSTRRVLASVMLTTAMLATTAFPAGAAPVNPSDSEIAQATGAAQAAQGEVSDLAKSLSSSDAQIASLELEMGGLRERVNKALVDYHDAQTAAEQARRGVESARKDLEDTQAQLDRGQKLLDEISRSEYRRTAAGQEVESLAGEANTRDALDRQTYKRINSEEQRKVVERLDRLRTEQANEESSLRKARELAESRESAASQAQQHAQDEIDAADAALQRNIRERADLITQRDAAQRKLDAARGNISTLEGQRKEYQEYLKAEEARKKAAEQARAAAEAQAKAEAEQKAREEAAAKARAAAEEAKRQAEQQQAAEAQAKAAEQARAAEEAEAAANKAKAEAAAKANETQQANSEKKTTSDASADAAAAVIQASEPEHTALGEGAGNPNNGTMPAVQNPDADSVVGGAPEDVKLEQVQTTNSVTEQATKVAGSGDRASKIETVIARAMSQIGVPYAWGGGNANGPTLGIRDGGVADSYGDYNKVGFDCSGLVLYAFAGVGIALPHYTGYQYQHGTKVDPSQMQRGDLIFYGPNAEQHVAIYLGNGQMIEAPQSGSTVHISPVRWSGMTSSVIRLI